MTRKTLKLTAEFVIGLMVCFAFLIGYFIWNLSKGPVAVHYLDFLGDIILDLPENSSLHSNEVFFIWEEKDNELSLKFNKMSLRGINDVSCANIDSAKFTFRTGDILSGNIIPYKVKISKPEAYLEIHDEEKELWQCKNGFILANFRELIKSTDSEKRGRFLDIVSIFKKFEIENGDLTFQDREADEQWVVSKFHFYYELAPDWQMTSKFIVQEGKKDININANAQYFPETEEIIGRLHFNNISLSEIAKRHPTLHEFKDFNVPISGHFDMALDRDTAFFEAVSFKLEANEGSIHLESEKPFLDVNKIEFDVEKLNVEANYSREKGILTFETLDLDIGDGVKLGALDPVNLDKVHFEGVWDFNNSVLNAKSLWIDFDGNGFLIKDIFESHIPSQRLWLKGLIDLNEEYLLIEESQIDLNDTTLHAQLELFRYDEDAYQLNLAGSLFQLPVKSLKQIWPVMAVKNARTWIKENVSEGVVNQIQFYLSVSSNKSFSNIDVKQARVNSWMQDVRLRYSPTMPEISNLESFMILDDKGAKFSIISGDSERLSIDYGTFELTDFDKPDQFARGEVFIKDKASDAAYFLSKTPLEFFDRFDIQPSQFIAGQVEGKLNFSLPLINDLDIDQIDLDIDVKSNQVKVEDVLLGYSLESASLNFKGDLDDYELISRGHLNEKPFALTLKENSSTRQSLFQLKTVLSFDNIRDRSRFLSYFDGDFPVTVKQKQLKSGNFVYDFNVDLTNTSIDPDYISWQKEKGEEAHLSFRLQNKKDYYRIMSASAEGKGIEVEGELDLYKDFDIKDVNLSTVQLGPSNFTLNVRENNNQSYHWQLSGKQLHIQPFQNLIKAEKVDNSSEKLPENDRYEFALENIILSEKSINLGPLKGGVEFKEDQIIHSNIQLGEGKRYLFLDINRRQAPGYFIFRMEDMGEMAKLLNITDQIEGGRFIAKGQYVSSENSTMIGEIELSSYRLKEIPLLINILNLATLTGFIDAFSGEGVLMEFMKAEFQFDNGTLRLKKGRSSGLSLGLTFEGNINQNKIDLEGSIIPAYLINSLIGKIPLVGEVLVGGKGEGIVGIKYHINGSLENPEVSANPLSTIAPGFLRQLF